MWEKWLKWSHPCLKLGLVWNSGNADRPLAGAEWIAVLQGWMLSCPPSPIQTIVLKEEETRQWYKKAHMLHTLQLTGIAQDLVETQNLVKSCSNIFSYLLEPNLWFSQEPISMEFKNLNHIWSLRSARNGSGLWSFYVQDFTYLWIQRFYWFLKLEGIFFPCRFSAS